MIIVKSYFVNATIVSVWASLHNNYYEILFITNLFCTTTVCFHLDSIVIIIKSYFILQLSVFELDSIFLYAIDGDSPASTDLLLPREASHQPPALAESSQSANNYQVCS